MATEEHLKLANIIKDCHDELRKSSKILGPENAWQEHLKNVEQLQTYSKAMETLSSLWETNAKGVDSSAKSRITWIIDYCTAYFLSEKILFEKRQKELYLNTVLNLNLSLEDYYLAESDKIRLLDVGSCFNPFREIDIFEVTAIDLCPSNDSVFKGDFLEIEVHLTGDAVVENNTIRSLPKEFYDCVVFSLLLEYMPTSDQRILCCQKAYELLRFEGILIIVTPDSQHVGKNAKIMKCWRYTLAKIGFSRIKFAKFPHITCLVFRKALAKCITERWADMHREEYMTFCLNTPQDVKSYDDNKS